MEAEIIHRFLESVGQKADVDLYLKLFRAQKKESFAIIVPSARIVRTALDPLHFDLRILAGLGLYPVVLLGLFDPRDADKQAQRVYEWLIEDGVPAKIVPAGATLDEADRAATRDTILANTIPILSLERARNIGLDARFDLLEKLAATLETRKVLFLSTSTGLQRDDAPHLNAVNLSTDYDRLLASSTLTRRHTSLLRHAKDLLEKVPQRMNVAVANPLHLLRELFTVSGAGTLIRKGARIESHPGIDRVDRARLAVLLESAFGKPLRAGLVEPGGALERETARIYLDENYLGAALLTNTPVGVYLTKFAVERHAQGEGIGGDLWSVMVRDYPSFFWRARPRNPITPWYAKQCDGLARFPDWHVFWRGLPPSAIQPAIEYALSAAEDFEDPPAPAVASAAR